KKEWKDVVQYRSAERGDTIYALDLAGAIERPPAAPAKVDSDADKDSTGTPGARAITTSPLRVDDLVTSPDGNKLAFASNAINQRQEKVKEVEIYVIDLANPSAVAAPRALTHNQAVEGRLHWANDSRHIFFSVEVGDVTGPYEGISASPGSSRVAFVYTSMSKPAEVYLAESASALDQAKPVTAFNKL